MLTGSALGSRNHPMTELLSSGLVCFVFSTKHYTCYCGRYVALLYPSFHSALITVTALSGIYVKNSSDMVGKNVLCVYHLCDSETCLELYCNLKDVLIKYFAVPASVR